MIAIEVQTNGNCAPVDLRVFRDLAPWEPVDQVRLERDPGRPHWHDVTGWTLGGEPCPARLCKIEDSGDGVAFLLYGGDAGLRLKPAMSIAGDGAAPVQAEPSWRLDDPGQWGEPFLILADPCDVRLHKMTERPARQEHRDG